jgi:hypothetical protein
MTESIIMKRKGISYYLKFSIPIIGVLFLSSICLIALKNVIGKSKLETEGYLTIGYFDTILWARGYDYVYYNYTINRNKYNGSDFSKGLSSKNNGDKFWILYLPSDPGLSKLLRDKKGNVVMYKDGSEVKTYIYQIKP